MGKLLWATLAPRRSIMLADIFFRMCCSLGLFNLILLPSHSPVTGVRLTLPSEGSSNLLLHLSFFVHRCPLTPQISCLFNPALVPASQRTQNNTTLLQKFNYDPTDNCAQSLKWVMSQGLRHVPLVIIQGGNKSSFCILRKLMTTFNHSKYTFTDYQMCH